MWHSKHVIITLAISRGFPGKRKKVNYSVHWISADEVELGYGQLKMIAVLTLLCTYSAWRWSCRLRGFSTQINVSYWSVWTGKQYFWCFFQNEIPIKKKNSTKAFVGGNALALVGYILFGKLRAVENQYARVSISVEAVLGIQSHSLFISRRAELSLWPTLTILCAVNIIA